MKWRQSNNRGGSAARPAKKAVGNVLDEAATNTNKCYGAAVRLLGTREYSMRELSTKLERRFSPATVAVVAGELQAQNLQCDERYGEAFCRSRVARGYGPVFIVGELTQNGLDKELIESLLEPFAGEWLDLAVTQARKKASNSRSLGNFDDSAPLRQDVCEPHDASNDWQSSNSLEPLTAEERRKAWQSQQKERARLARFLARRGFSAGVSSKAIAQVLDRSDADMS